MQCDPQWYLCLSMNMSVNFQLASFHCIQVIRRRKNLTKGHNSSINASRVMDLVIRKGLKPMNMYAEFHFKSFHSTKVIRLINNYNQGT